jgi:hypothetical protein
MKKTLLAIGLTASLLPFTFAAQTPAPDTTQPAPKTEKKKKTKKAKKEKKSDDTTAAPKQ